MEAMNERGKELEAYGDHNAADNQLFTSSPELPCKKHPQSSTDGICAYCLRDRLLELVVCGECGEQRPSSCSCSSAISSSDPNSTATAVELVTSRISFLIENENGEPKTNEIIQKTSDGNKGDEVFTRRSNSSSLGNANAKERTRRGIWNIARVFRRKRNKGDHEPAEKSEILVSDLMGMSRISRSRSFCSFRAGGDRSGRYVFDNEDIGGVGVSSAARVSSSVIESAKRSCFSESEARISNFEWERDNAAAFVHKTSSSSSIFSWKECEFMACGDDPRFIDLKLDLTSEAKPEISGLRRSEFGGSFENGAWRGGFKEKEGKQQKGWRWFFKRSSKLGSHRRGDEGRNSFMY